MDYKKKYEDALERCKKEFNFSNLAYSHEEIKERLEHVFPELKESDDERIRKELVRAFTTTADKREHEIYGNGITYGQVLAWLEKQGEILENIKYKEAMLDCQTCANYKNECFPDRNIFKCSYPIKYSEKNTKNVNYCND